MRTLLNELLLVVEYVCECQGFFFPGLIIDAFGELRDQQESATEKLESSCFICDINKETFDRIPRGFEIHVTKEHNFASYLFVPVFFKLILGNFKLTEYLKN